MMRTIILAVLCFPYFVNAQMDSLAVQSPEAITSKMLEVISGDINEPRDWETFRNLFLPSAQMISINPNANPRNQVRVMNLEEFVRYVGPLYKRDGFDEYTIGLVVNEFNGIANVFQSFYCRNLTGTYENRGVNSYQLVYSADRWWIASTAYANESKDVKLTNDLLFESYQIKE